MHSGRWEANTNKDRCGQPTRPILGQNLYAEDRLQPETPFRPSEQEDKEINLIKTQIAKV